MYKADLTFASSCRHHNQTAELFRHTRRRNRQTFSHFLPWSRHATSLLSLPCSLSIILFFYIHLQPDRLCLCSKSVCLILPHHQCSYSCFHFSSFFPSEPLLLSLSPESWVTEAQESKHLHTYSMSKADHSFSGHGTSFSLLGCDSVGCYKPRRNPLYC